MSNQTEYFQHLVDTCEDPQTKWILMAQLETEQRRARKAKLLRQREAQLALEVKEPEVETQTTEEPKKRGRPSKQEQ